MELIKECIACGSDRLKPHSMRFDADSPHISRVICRDCDLIFSNPMATEIELISFYKNYYDKGNFELFNYKDNHRKKFTHYDTLSKKQLEKTFNYVLDYKRGGNFLDIGFGLGEPLFLANRFGFSIYGTEFDKDAIDFIKQYVPNGSFVNEDLNNASFEDGFFDFIRFWHVIEHVRNPDIYVKEISRVLKSDGILMIGTPNIGCKAYSIHRFIMHYLLRIPTILDGMEHTVLFSKKRLKKILEKNGFKVIKQYSHGRKENYIKLLKEPISIKKKLARIVQSGWDVDQTVYAVKMN